MKGFRLLTSDHIRSFVLGVEDSLVSTVGLVSGIAAAGSSRSTILLTGVILVFVEAFSMAVGELLTETTVKEFENRKDVPLHLALFSAFVMLVSYIFSGSLVLLSYVVIPDINDALPSSIAVALCSLFILGVLTARFSHTHPLRKGFVMASVGGVAILIGVSAGFVVQNL